MINVSGNHGLAFMTKAPGGVGAVNLPVSMGWVSVSASKAGDSHVVQLSSIVASQIAQGVFFQAENSATVEFTLANPAIAADSDPLNSALAPWNNSLTVTSTIVKAPVLFTACKITFAAPGTVYIGVR